MADGQDIIGLGLDIGSFNAAKKKTLKEFIQLFNDLSKWDGKIFNPVLGDGLAKFNTSVATTNKTLDELNTKLSTLNSGLSGTGKQSGATSAQIQALTSKITQQQKELAALKLQLSETSKQLVALQNGSKSATKVLGDEDRSVKNLITDYQILKRTLQEQADAYRNLSLTKGKDSPQAKRALGDYAQTVSVVDKLDKQLESAEPKAFGLGKGLSTMYNQLRIIAYILPGFGIAGIFNLIFESIGKVAEAMGIFNSKTLKALEYDKAFNSILSEQIKLFEELVSLNKQYSESFSNTSLRKLENAKDILSAQGASKNLIFPAQGDVNSLSLLKASRELVFNRLEGRESRQRGEGDIPSQKEIEEALKRQEGYQNKQIQIIEKAKQRISSIRTQLETSKNTTFLGFGEGDTDKLKKQLELANSELDVARTGLEESGRIVTAYNSADKKLKEDALEYSKFLADEERKLVYETAKSNIAVKINESEKILNAEISSEIERIKALRSIRASQKSANAADYTNIVDNNSSTDAEKKIALVNKINADKKANAEYNESLLKLTEDYRQRRLTAALKINKSEVEIESTKNERLFKDETQTLEVRLKAYQTYLLKRQTLQNLEYTRNIDVLSLKSDDPTARQQIEALRAERDVQKTNIQADAEKQVYDITYQSLTRELNLVKDFNKLEEDANNAQYTISLRNLNNSFESKKISYQKYYEARKAIDRKYRIQFLDDTIENDKDQIERTQKLITKHQKDLEQANQDVDSNNVILTDAKNFGRDTLAPQRGYDEAIGRQKAISDALIKEYKVLLENKNKLDKDELARELERIQEKIDKEKEAQREKLSIISSIEQAEKAVYDAVTTIVDRSYDRRIAKIDELSKAIEEQANKEIAAIQNSSLAEKDKTALLIQLTAEKEVREKQAAAETKRLRREQAEFDKKASIAQILFSTALAEIKVFTGAGTYYEKLAQYIATGVIGAAALALAVSADIPSYEEGTKGKPHKGGLARTGEKGKPELIKEPYRSPYLVTHDNISYLPAGTEVVPLVNNFPVFSGGVKDNSYENTRAIVSAIKNSNKEIKNVFKPNIYIDTNFLKYKSSILN